MTSLIEKQLDACAQNIESREPMVKAFAYLDLAGARREILARRGSSFEGALGDIVMGVKDIIDVANMPCEAGSPLRAGRLPLSDATVVRILRRAGAVVIGKTATSEFAGFNPSCTTNPLDVRRTPGGSSSGSAAAVASGMVTAALGTQTGGSVIRPASYCGIVGFKPTFGRLDRRGMFILSPSLDTIGVLATDVGIVERIMGALVAPTLNGASAHDPVRVGLLPSDLTSGADSAVFEAVLHAAEHASATGCEVSRVDRIAWWSEVHRTHRVVMRYEAARSLRNELREDRSQLSANLLEMLDEGVAISPDEYSAALRRTALMRRAVQAIFARHDVLLGPATMGEAPIGLESTGDPYFCLPWSLLGNPAVVVPTSTGSAGMPIGIQLAGAHGDDLRLLASSKAFEGHG